MRTSCRRLIPLIKNSPLVDSPWLLSAKHAASCNRSNSGSPYAFHSIGPLYVSNIHRSRRLKSPYTLSVLEQISLNLDRGFKRLKADMSLTYTALFGNFFISLILGSVFYNLPSDTSSFYSREVLLFYAVLLAAFASALEVRSLPYLTIPLVF